MSDFIVGCALGFLCVGCIAAPFVAPWRIRVRYLVAAQVADPVFGVGPPRDVTLREVQLTHVDAEGGHVDLVVEEAGVAPASRRRALTRESCAPSVVAKLDGWSTTHEPLLMVVDESGDIHLYGPDGAVTYLSRAEEKTR
jgi:hypothetical protein